MKQIIIIVVAAALGAFSFWTLSPLFIDREIQDELDLTLQARIEAQKKVDAARENRESLLEKTVDPEETSTTETKNNENVGQSFGIQSRGPFEIIGTTGHPAQGEIEIIESPEEKLVYYKNYDGTNGPDLKVYLSKDLEASEIVDLGDARGNQGNIIYGLPLDININEYKYVLTWCEAFGVLFDYAEIN